MCVKGTVGRRLTSPEDGVMRQWRTRWSDRVTDEAPVNHISIWSECSRSGVCVCARARVCLSLMLPQTQLCKILQYKPA